MSRKAITFLAAWLALICLTPDLFPFPRGGGGGGRGGGGGGRSGGGASYRSSGYTSAARTVQSSSTHRSASGPGGHTYQSGKGSGSVTTKGGATVDYKGAAAGRSTNSGFSSGKYVGGVKVTGPGGQTATKVSKGGAAKGPGGNTVGGKRSVGATTGPRGTAVGASRTGVAAGPGGAAVRHTGAVATSRGTYYRSAGAIRGQGAYVRAACVPYHGYFSPRWYAQYPGAWVAAGWAATTAWRAATVGAVSSTLGYPVEADYDYGSSVVYQDDSVYVDGVPTGTPEQYSKKATAIAAVGKETTAKKSGEWLPLGVFAMVQGNEETSSNLFQLAINKEGIIRGNYYNALTDTSETVYGSVDKKSQRAAWTVGNKKKPVYEAGIANLTMAESTMMVHFGKDRSQQFTLVRIEKGDKGEGGEE